MPSGKKLLVSKITKLLTNLGNSILLICYMAERGQQSDFAGARIIRFKSKTPAFWRSYRYYQKFLAGTVDAVIEFAGSSLIWSPLFVREPKVVIVDQPPGDITSRNISIVPALAGKRIDNLFTTVYRHAPAFTLSESVSQQLQQMGYKGEIQVLSAAPDFPSLRRLPEKESQPTLIHCGRLAPSKGVENLIRLFSKVLGKFSHSRLWIVGQGSPRYEQHLRRLARRMHLRSKIIFWGYVSTETKKELISRAHLLINCSFSEGWGQSVLEAAALGTPAVVNNVPGVSDSVKDGITGYIASTRNMEAMAEKVTSLLENQLLYRRMQKNCLAEAKVLSWQKAGWQVLETLRQVASLSTLVEKEQILRPLQ